jgi:hypothetical protein
MGKVYFPIATDWAEKLVDEMLAFPNGTHDDFGRCFELYRPWAAKPVRRVG